MRFQRSRTGRDWRRNSRGRIGAGRLLRCGERDQQRYRRSGAEAEHGSGPGRDVAVGAAIGRCLAGDLLGAERDEIALVTETFVHRRHRLDQFAIGGENRRRPIEIREQSVHAVGQSEAFVGALSRNHQHSGTVVGEHDARAKTDQRAAIARAESAQPFKPRRATLRQRAGQACDLRGGCMLWLEADGGKSAR